MTAKKIKEQFKNEYNSIMPDFDKILANINSVEVLLQPVVAPVKQRNPRFVNVWNKNVEVEAKQPKFKLSASLMSLCVCVMLIAVSMFYCGVFALDSDLVIELDKHADSYVSLNINPEFDFAVNKFNKITTVKSKNESSKLLLSQLYNSLSVDTLVGMELNGALLSVIDEAAKMGYIDVSAKSLSNAVMIDVVGSNIGACANTKELLAAETNNYFAEKGILAVVVTNYDSKAALLAEAKKANPNISNDASIGELISTVEIADGGKSLYELEIERIKKENGDYSAYLDSDEVSRVQFAASEKIYLYNDLIAKQEKIMTNLESLRVDYNNQLADKQLALDALQADKDYYAAEIAKINADPESYGSALIIKQKLDDVEENILLTVDEIKDIQSALTNLDKEIETKLKALQNSQIELQNAITIIEDANSSLSSTIASDKANLLVKNNELKLQEKLIDEYDGKLAASNYIGQLNEIVSGVGQLQTVAILELGAIFNDKYKNQAVDKKDKCVNQIPEYTAMKILEIMADTDTLICDLSKMDGGNASISIKLDIIIAQYYKEVINDTGLFNPDEISHNNNNTDIGKVARLIKPYFSLFGINEDVSGVISNLSVADTFIESLSMINGKVAVNVDLLMQEAINVAAYLSKNKAAYDNAVKDYPANIIIVKQLEDSIAENEKELASNVLKINELQVKLDDVNKQIVNLDHDKLVEMARLNALLDQKSIALESLKAEKKQLVLDLQTAVDYNKQRVIDYNNAIVAIDGSVGEINKSISEINAKIDGINQENLKVKDLILGYNQIIKELKTFSANYKRGERFVCQDKSFEGQFNAEIQKIEDQILSLRSASEQEMQDSIKNNIDKMANAKLDKNINKYNGHSETLTKDELDSWQKEQEEYLNEQGWESIYNAWLASQNN